MTWIHNFGSCFLVFFTALSAGQTLDLKLLLRLPMNKLRDLRTYLVNHGIAVLASDRQIYKELKVRRTLTEDIIEVGTMSLAKTAKAGEPSDVAYVKVREILPFLQETINIHHSNGKMCNNNDEYHDEIWLKIGGDKGGSTTKLVAQVCNITNPNSAVTTDILCMYEAVDTYANMEEVFGPYHQQFVDLQTEAHVKVNEEEKSLRVFLFGDYEFLTKIVGHMGPNAVHPCLWCYVHRDELRKPFEERELKAHTPKIYNPQSQKWEDNPKWPKERTPGDMTNDLAACKADQRNNGDPKVNARNYHSVCAETLFPMCIDHSHIVPPILHIMLGLTVRFFKEVEDICRSNDQGETLKSNDDLYKQWESETLVVQSNTEICNKLKEEVQYRKEILKGFTKYNTRRSGRSLEDECDFPSCAIAKQRVRGAEVVDDEDDDIQWVECESCVEESWYHVDCVGLRGVNYASEEFVFECPKCKGDVRGPEDVVQWQKNRVESVESELKESEKELKAAKGRLDKIYESVKSVMGEREKELNCVLEDDLGVKRQAYHSQSFVGNHCQKILANSDKILKPLNGLEEKERYSELFKRLSHILLDFTEAKFLTSNEVQDLCHSCWSLGEWFPRNFPNETIPPKLHILIAHVPECALAWGTLGILSEHGVESLHALINSDIRQFACVRDSVEQMKLVYNQHCHRAVVNSKGLERKKRKRSDADLGSAKKLCESGPSNDT